MSWIYVADDGEQIHYDIHPRVAELEQELAQSSDHIIEQERGIVGRDRRIAELEQQLAALRKVLGVLAAATNNTVLHPLHQIAMAALKESE